MRKQQKRRNTEHKENEQNLYEPESILDYRFFENEHEYLVLWKGYPRSESTWETFKNMQHCTWLFQEFQEKNENKAIERLQTEFVKILQITVERPKYFNILKRNGETEWIRTTLVRNFDKNKTWAFMKSLKDKGAMQNEISDLGERKPHLTINYKRYVDYKMKRESDLKQSSDQVESSSESDNELDKSQFNKSLNKQMTKPKTKTTTNRTNSTSTKPKRIRIRNKKKPDEKSFLADIQFLEDFEGNSQKQIPSKDPLPQEGTIGIDIPHEIRNMVIDKKIGLKSDGYFACDVTWKIRSNMNQPLDSRVSRQILKEKHPIVLIKFYEDRMTFEDASTQNQKSEELPESAPALTRDLLEEFQTASTRANSLTESTVAAAVTDLHTQPEYLQGELPQKRTAVKCKDQQQQRVIFSEEVSYSQIYPQFDDYEPPKRRSNPIEQICSVSQVVKPPTTLRSNLTKKKRNEIQKDMIDEGSQQFLSHSQQMTQTKQSLRKRMETIN